jgi:ATP-binding cassette subfamily B protein
MATVKLFAHARREEEVAHRALKKFRAAALAFGRTVQAFRGLLAILMGILPVILIGTALWLWAAGQAGLGMIAMSGYIALRISHMSGWLSFTAMGIFANVGVVEDGIRTLTPSHEIVDAPNAMTMEKTDGAIAFENVEFNYGNASGAGLNGFSTAIRPGEKVALVGRSGAGKSTAVSLLLRLYDVENGLVTLDGTDIRELAQDFLRTQIAMVTQETAMFNRSALDNILYGQPGASREAAVAAAKDAAADEFIQALRDHEGREGYDAHLGERGVKLSGGQRQRIALARAILKDAPILVLDEATAALDSETEEVVQSALQKLMQGRTVIAIAHRLSTIARMDRILVMDAGRIVEEGGHSQLLARNGLYASFWARQSDGFIGVEAAE